MICPTQGSTVPTPFHFAFWSIVPLIGWDAKQSFAHFGHDLLAGSFWFVSDNHSQQE